MRNRGFSVAYGEQVENSNDIKLLPSGAFAQYRNEYTALTNLPSGISVLLQDVIPSAQNFFYLIESCDTLNFNRNVLSSERGIGQIFFASGSHYLKRDLVTSFNDGAGEIRKQAAPSNFENQNIIINTYIPDYYYDMLIYPYSVLCSIEPGNPASVAIEENSVLGRLNNTIQSVDKNALRAILTDENIVGAIEDRKYLTLDRLILQPSGRPQNPTQGTIIFNPSGFFEGYNGSTWATLI